MTIALPGYGQVFTSLRRHGEQFPAANRRITPMKGVLYRRAEDNQPCTAHIDEYALSGVTNVYGGTPTLRSALSQRGVQMNPLTDLRDVIASIFDSPELILGFSGYGMAGHSYKFEARVMDRILHHLKRRNQAPALVCDGGVSDGVPGLSGALAAHFKIPSLGYIPLEGLSEFGPRALLGIRMDTYAQRQKLVGYTADLLAAMHGGPGTIDECVHTVNSGGVVLHVMSRGRKHHSGSLSASYQDVPALRKALGKGRFIVCDDLNFLSVRIEEARQAALYAAMTSRSRRMKVLSEHLQ